MANGDDWERLFNETADAFGGVDILVYNAATAAPYGPIARTDGEAWDLVMKVNRVVADRRNLHFGAAHVCSLIFSRAQRRDRGCVARN
jgi:NAD(P)-dependent dehydrogenase (short-subunit alcohol dehydrogenase family)